MSERAQGNAEILAYVSTKQPLDGGRIGLPGDLDGAALFFMSDESRFVTGQVLSVDGGWCVSEGQVPVRAAAEPTPAQQVGGVLRTLGRIWGKFSRGQ